VVVREYHQLLSVNALLPTLTNVETNKTFTHYIHSAFAMVVLVLF